MNSTSNKHLRLCNNKRTSWVICSLKSLRARRALSKIWIYQVELIHRAMTSQTSDKRTFSVLRTTRKLSLLTRKTKKWPTW